MTEQAINLQRRTEDRDRAIMERLQHLETENASLQSKVNSLQNDVNVVRIEQAHVKDLFTARLSVIERGQELQLSKIEGIASSISNMASDAEKTPAGRSLITMINQSAAQSQSNADTLEAHARSHGEIEKWRNQIEGVVYLLKWLGASGLIALALGLLRLAKVLP